MANTYYDMTGILYCTTVTPVIQAVFGAYDLKPGYCEEPGQLYIADQAESTSANWENTVEKLHALAVSLDAYTLEERALLAADSWHLRVVFHALARHFNVTGANLDIVKEIWKGINDPYQDASLTDLDALARLFDDGHGYTGLQVQGAWHSDQMRLSGFGGNGLYLTQDVSLRSSSSEAERLGQKLGQALGQGDSAAAADEIFSAVTKMLNSIRSVDLRDQVSLALLERLDRVGQGDPDASTPTERPQG